MYLAMQRIYLKTKDEKYLTNAVTKGWLTENEKAEIIADIA